MIPRTSARYPKSLNSDSGIQKGLSADEQSSAHGPFFVFAPQRGRPAYNPASKTPLRHENSAKLIRSFHAGTKKMMSYLFSSPGVYACG
jgi:hypothetical protein